MPGGARRTRATAVPSPPIAVVALPAEIDISNTGLVQATLTRALAARPKLVIADGTGTVFCDCAGITALRRAHREAAAAGAQLRVVITSARVRQVLKLTGTDQVLLVYPSVAAAQADRSHRPAPSPAAGTGCSTP